MWPGVTMEEQSSSSGEAPKPAPKSKALWIVVAVIVVVVVVLAAAVLGGLFSPTKSHLRIRTLLSLTGGFSIFGPGDPNGANPPPDEITNPAAVRPQRRATVHDGAQTPPVEAHAP